MTSIKPLTLGSMSQATHRHRRPVRSISICQSLGISQDGYIIALDVDLPPIKFSLDQSNEQVFYIPLESLLLPPNVFHKEEGAPYVNINGNMQRLCVIDNGEVYDSSNTIVLGTLALHSLYFAADFSSNAVGLASKLSSSYVDNLASRTRENGAKCSARTICKGNS